MPPAFIGGFVTALTSGVIAFGAPTAAFAAGVAAAGTFGPLIITGALVVGARLLTQALSPQQAGAFNTNEARGSIRQATPIQRVIYGNARVGGALFFHEDQDPPLLTWGLLLSARPIHAVNNVVVGAKSVIFEAQAYGTGVGSGLGDGFPGDCLTVPWFDTIGSYLRMNVRRGLPGQERDVMLITTPSGETLDDDTFIQAGTATVSFEAEYGADAEQFERLWGLGTQIPNILLDVSGTPIHDPREPTSDPEDPTTWRFSRNASLIQADVLRASYGGRVPSSKMRWDKIADAANYDDELVADKSGNLHPRYTIDGVLSLDQTPGDMLQAILTANAGFVASDQGRLWVTSSRPQTPVLTITDNMMQGGILYQHTRRRDSLLNTVRTRFVAEEREYQVVDGPVRIREDLLEEDGQTFEDTLSLNYTLTHQRAQRLADLALRGTRLQRGLTTALPTRRAIGLQPGQVVMVDSRNFPHMNGVYQVEAIGYSEDFTQRPVTLTEYDGSLANQYVASTDELPFEIVDEALEAA